MQKKKKKKIKKKKKKKKISFCAFTDAFLSLLTLWLHKRYVDFVSTEVLCFVSFFNCKIYFAAGRDKNQFQSGSVFHSILCTVICK